MSLEQDLLFCKIAISNQMVSPEDAQKCLAIAKRFEAEGKRRPQVGEVFLKKNLLSDQDVTRINGAVQKRLGQQAPAAEAAAPGRSPMAAPVRRQVGGVSPAGGVAGMAARPAGRRVIRQRQHAEPIDPRTLWMGVIFGCIALGCLFAILYLILASGGEPPPPPDTNVGIPGKASPAPVPSAPGAAAPAKVSAGPDLKADPPAGAAPAAGGGGAAAAAVPPSGPPPVAPPAAQAAPSGTP